MTDEEYNALQLVKVSDEDNEDYLMQIRSQTGTTKWLLITPKQFEAIRKALT